MDTLLLHIFLLCLMVILTGIYAALCHLVSILRDILDLLRGDHNE